MVYIALLRGINVGGHGILPMARLKTIAEKAGLKNVRTYIQSGNLVFESNASGSSVMYKLAGALRKSEGIDIPVIIRTGKELDKIISEMPFPKANPAQIGVAFFASPIPKNAFDGFVNKGPEEIVSSGRNLYIHYPLGMGKSKLHLPKPLQSGTVRNMNTVTKLLALAQ